MPATTHQTLRPCPPDDLGVPVVRFQFAPKLLHRKIAAQLRIPRLMAIGIDIVERHDPPHRSIGIPVTPCAWHCMVTVDQDEIVRS